MLATATLAGSVEPAVVCDPVPKKNNKKDKRRRKKKNVIVILKNLGNQYTRELDQSIS